MEPNKVWLPVVCLFDSEFVHLLSPETCPHAEFSPRANMKKWQKKIYEQKAADRHGSKQQLRAGLIEPPEPAVPPEREPAEEVASPQHHEPVELWWERNAFMSRKVLGAGTYGKVLLVKDASGQEFAAKLYHKDLMDAQVELDHYKKLGTHPNILGCYGVISSREQIGLLLELAETSLFDYLRKYPLMASDGSVTQATRHAQVLMLRWQMSLQLSRGLLHMHAKGITHGDCKASNCLLSLKPLTVKWADLGLAVIANSQVAGKKMYSSLHRPPECRQKRMMTITPASDAWAFGLVAFSLFATGGVLSLFPDDPELYESKFIEVRLRMCLSHDRTALSAVRPLLTSLPRGEVASFFDCAEKHLSSKHAQPAS